MTKSYIEIYVFTNKLCVCASELLKLGVGLGEIVISQLMMVGFNLAMKVPLMKTANIEVPVSDLWGR